MNQYLKCVSHVTSKMHPIGVHNLGSEERKSLRTIHNLLDARQSTRGYECHYYDGVLQESMYELE